MSIPSLTPNAIRVLQGRYLKRDKDGKIVETPSELFARVAKAIAGAETVLGNAGRELFWQERFHELLTSLDFLPNSPALMNAGMPLGQLSACFVIPIEDTMEGIFESLKQAALVQRTGGGTGFSFSALRPKGDIVESTGGEASGPVSFMKIFDSATEHIKQGGKRRGANMGVLRVDHPDILEFIMAKREQEALHNFNISVAVTDVFLEAVRNRESYDLIHPRTHARVDRIPAQPVFDAIVEAAWETGDPGLLFWDAINRTNPTPSLGTMDATNPCGEIPLLPNEACNLGSINLAHHLDLTQTPAAVNWEKLRATTHTAIRFLDNMVEINRYPNPDIETMSRHNRKVGLGVMGFAELLIRMGIPYNSKEALIVGEQIMQEIAHTARQTSAELAQERGVFANWSRSIYPSHNIRIRNATCTAIAPTGTISIIAGTTAGIEPLFALYVKRSHTLGGEPLIEEAPLLTEYWPEGAPDSLPSSFGNPGHTSDETAVPPPIPEKVKRLFVTALEISSETHLQVQAAFQRHVENSVSKTINLPKEAQPEDIRKAYWRAWELGLKGVTVFRYGSKGTQVLEVKTPEMACHQGLGPCPPC